MANLNIGVKFKADATDISKSISAAMSSLKQVSSMSVGKDFGADINKSLVKASESAVILQEHLKKAYSPEVGKINLTQLDKNLQLSGRNLQMLLRDLRATGPVGEQAFSQISAVLRGSQGEIKQTSKLINSMKRSFVDSLKWDTSMNIIQGMRSSFGEAIKYVEGLDRALVDIRITSLESQNSLKDFGLEANRSAKDLGVSTKAYAEAALEFIRQGDNQDTVRQKTELTLKSARVAGIAAREMSEQLTATWNSFNMNAEERERSADVLAHIGAQTATGFEEMTTATQKAGAAAAAVGVPFEQLAAMIGTVSSVTRTAPEEIGTAMKTLMARMADLKFGDEGEMELGKVSETLETVGIQIFDATGQIRDMGSVINDLGNSWDTFDKNTQTAVAQALAGKRQYTQLFALLGNWDHYQASLQLAEESAGAVDRQFAAYSDGIEAAKARFSAAKEGIIQENFDSDVIKDFYNNLTKVANGVNEVVKALGGVEGIVKKLVPLMGMLFSDKIGESAAKINLGFADIAKSEAHILRQVDLASYRDEPFIPGKELESFKTFMAEDAKVQMDTIYDRVAQSGESMSESIATMVNGIGDVAGEFMVGVKASTADIEEMKKIVETQISQYAEKEASTIKSQRNAKVKEGASANKQYNKNQRKYEEDLTRAEENYTALNEVGVKHGVIEGYMTSITQSWSNMANEQMKTFETQDLRQESLAQTTIQMNEWINRNQSGFKDELAKLGVDEPDINNLLNFDELQGLFTDIQDGHIKIESAEDLKAKFETKFAIIEDVIEQKIDEMLQKEVDAVKQAQGMTDKEISSKNAQLVIESGQEVGFSMAPSAATKVQDAYLLSIQEQVGRQLSIQEKAILKNIQRQDMSTDQYVTSLVNMTSTMTMMGTNISSAGETLGRMSAGALTVEQSLKNVGTNALMTAMSFGRLNKYANDMTGGMSIPTLIAGSVNKFIPSLFKESGNQLQSAALAGGAGKIASILGPLGVIVGILTAIKALVSFMKAKREEEIKSLIKQRDDAEKQTDDFKAIADEFRQLNRLQEKTIDERSREIELQKQLYDNPIFKTALDKEGGNVEQAMRATEYENIFKEIRKNEAVKDKIRSKGFLGKEDSQVSQVSQLLVDEARARLKERKEDTSFENIKGILVSEFDEAGAILASRLKEVTDFNADSYGYGMSTETQLNTDNFTDEDLTAIFTQMDNMSGDMSDKVSKSLDKALQGMEISELLISLDKRDENYKEILAVSRIDTKSMQADNARDLDKLLARGVDVVQENIRNMGDNWNTFTAVEQSNYVSDMLDKYRVAVLDSTEAGRAQRNRESIFNSPELTRAEKILATKFFDSLSIAEQATTDLAQSIANADIEISPFNNGLSESSKKIMSFNARLGSAIDILNPKNFDRLRNVYQTGDVEGAMDVISQVYDYLPTKEFNAKYGGKENLFNLLASGKLTDKIMESLEKDVVASQKEDTKAKAKAMQEEWMQYEKVRSSISKALRSSQASVDKKGVIGDDLKYADDLKKITKIDMEKKEIESLLIQKGYTLEGVKNAQNMYDLLLGVAATMEPLEDGADRLSEFFTSLGMELIDQKDTERMTKELANEVNAQREAGKALLEAGDVKVTKENFVDLADLMKNDELKSMMQDAGKALQEGNNDKAKELYEAMIASGKFTEDQMSQAVLESFLQGINDEKYMETVQIYIDGEIVVDLEAAEAQAGTVIEELKEFASYYGHELDVSLLSDQVLKTQTSLGRSLFEQFAGVISDEEIADIVRQIAEQGLKGEKAISEAHRLVGEILMNSNAQDSFPNQNTSDYSKAPQAVQEQVRDFVVSSLKGEIPKAIIEVDFMAEQKRSTGDIIDDMKNLSIVDFLKDNSDKIFTVEVKEEISKPEQLPKDAQKEAQAAMDNHGPLKIDAKIETAIQEVTTPDATKQVQDSVNSVDSTVADTVMQPEVQVDLATSEIIGKEELETKLTSTVKSIDLSPTIKLDIDEVGITNLQAQLGELKDINLKISVDSKELQGVKSSLTDVSKAATAMSSTASLAATTATANSGLARASLESADTSAKRLTTTISTLIGSIQSATAAIVALGNNATASLNRAATAANKVKNAINGIPNKKQVTIDVEEKRPPTMFDLFKGGGNLPIARGFASPLMAGFASIDETMSSWEPYSGGTLDDELSTDELASLWDNHFVQPMATNFSLRNANVETAVGAAITGAVTEGVKTAGKGSTATKPTAPSKTSGLVSEIDLLQAILKQLTLITKSSFPQVMNEMKKGKDKDAATEKDSKSKKDKKEKIELMDEEIDRYTALEALIKRQQFVLGEVKKAKDAAYGSEWVLAMVKEGHEIKKNLEFLTQKRDMLWEDQQLQAKSIKDQYGASFDENAVLLNYYDILWNMQEKINSKIKAGGAKEDIDKDKEAFKEADEQLKKYMKTIEDYRTAVAAVTQEELQIQQQYFERIKGSIQYKIDLNNDDLQLIKYFITKLDGEFFRTSETLAASIAQIGSIRANLGFLSDGYAELNKAFEAGLITQKDYIDGVRDFRGQIQQNLESLITLDKKMLTAYANALSQASALWDKYYGQLTSIGRIMSTFKDMASMIGQGSNLETVGRILGEQANHGMNEIKASKDWYEMLLDQKTQIEQRLNNAPNEAARELFQKEYEAIIGELSKAQENLVNNTKNTLDILISQFQNSMAIANRELESALTNGSSFESLKNKHDVYDYQRDRFLDPIQKRLSVEMLLQKIQKEMDKDANKSRLEELQALKDKVASYHDQEELAHSILDIEEKKLGMIVAQAGADSTGTEAGPRSVKMVRTSDGQYDYAYTRDPIDKEEDEMLELLQKEKDYWDAIVKYQDETAEHRLSILEEFYSQIANINNDMSLTEEERLAKIEELQALTMEKLGINKAEFDAIMTEMDWARDFLSEELMLNELERSMLRRRAYDQEIAELVYDNTYFREVSNQNIASMNQSWMVFTAGLAQASSISGLSLQRLDMETQRLTVDSNQLAYGTLPAVTSAIQQELNAVLNLTMHYAQMRAEILALIAAYEQMMALMNAGIRGSAMKGGDLMATDWSRKMAEAMRDGDTKAYDYYKDMRDQKMTENPEFNKYISTSDLDKLLQGKYGKQIVDDFFKNNQDFLGQNSPFWDAIKETGYNPGQAAWDFLEKGWSGIGPLPTDKGIFDDYNNSIGGMLESYIKDLGGGDFGDITYSTLGDLFKNLTSGSNDILQQITDNVNKSQANLDGNKVFADLFNSKFSSDGSLPVTIVNVDDIPSPTIVSGGRGIQPEDFNGLKNKALQTIK